MCFSGLGSIASSVRARPRRIDEEDLHDCTIRTPHPRRSAARRARPRSASARWPPPPARPPPTGPRRPRTRAAGKTLTLRYYVETAEFVYRRADGTIAPQPPATAAVGDQLEITELGYKGTHKSHAKKSSASSYTVCHFKSAKGAPTCEGVLAIGGNQLLIFRTEAGGDPVADRRHGPLSPARRAGSR